MKNNLVGGLLLLISALAYSSPERPLDEMLIEDIKVEGLVQAWKFRKLCLDGQAYLLILGANQMPISITAAFKDGKPELCKGANQK
ncbi:MAG: hypothetical protein ACKOF9_04155 [Burkholderiales bacterium]